MRASKIINTIGKEAIIIFGSGLRKEKSGQWRTSDFYEKNQSFVSFDDRLRVKAGYYLHKENSEAFIIASGGKGKMKNMPDVPPVAKVIRGELLELGVPGAIILEESRSDNTYQELQALKEIIAAQKFRKVVIVSNDYHLLRIKAMIEYDAELKRLADSGRITLKSAEQILLKYAPGIWRHKIADAYKSEAMKRRVELEQKGIEEIKIGIYKF